MKPGDLVELSAYGKKLACNEYALGLIGLIVHVDNNGVVGIHPGTAITVQWAGSTMHMYQIRRDIKYVK